ncbi:MAG: hypothetical protein IPP12_17690 [Nitrospira sp.]|nr:hypothetical protein [Nitrospira sp.]
MGGHGHQWLSPAYFMEQPSWVQRHFDELESGMHVWICDVPSTMKMTTRLRRLQADIPPCRYSHVTPEPTSPPQYVIDAHDAVDDVALRYFQTTWPEHDGGV